MCVDPRIKQRFRTIVSESGLEIDNVVEVGGLPGPESLLRLPELRGAERVCVNIVERPSRRSIRFVTANANDMHMFDDGSFQVVLSNAMLEHDPRFWLSAAEMRRITRPGGLLVVGVPGFVEGLGTGQSTPTFRVHTAHDFYRFSVEAVRDVIFAGMDDVQVETLLNPPRIIGWGRKPLEGPSAGGSLRTRARRAVRRARSPRGEPARAEPTTPTAVR